MKIRASVLRKLKRIERLQTEVCRLVDEIEAEMGLANLIEPPDAFGASTGRTWATYVNPQRKPMMAADAEKLLLRFCGIEPDEK